MDELINMLVEGFPMDTWVILSLFSVAAVMIIMTGILTFVYEQSDFELESDVGLDIFKEIT